jgi:2-dehydropantoate 2-reductase
MNIGIMGAGAVGSYFAALLAGAGHSVTLVGRQAFVDEVFARGGLKLEMSGAVRIESVIASTDPAAIASSDLIIFAVKSTDTETAGVALAPYAKPSAIVLSFQNGVDNAERLEALLHRTVIPVAVYVAVEMVSPGHVKHNGRGDVTIGNSDRSISLATMFGDAGIPTTVSDQVNEALWAKLILNCAYNALSAVSQLPYGLMMTVPGVTDLMGDIVNECVAVGRASCATIADPDLTAVFSLARTMPDQLSSTAQDIARQKPTEIDHLNGLVVRKGQELGIATPANRALFIMVKLLEAKQSFDRSC